MEAYFAGPDEGEQQIERPHALLRLLGELELPGRIRALNLRAPRVGFSESIRNR